jgi:golgin subfamily B member 1
MADLRTISVVSLVTAMRAQGVSEHSIRMILLAIGIEEEARNEPETRAPQALHEILAGAQERKDWATVVAVTRQLAELEPDAGRRARYFYTAGIIQRNDLGDPEGAVETFDHALDCDPTMVRAFEAQGAILGARGDWKQLERAHRKMLVRVRHGDDRALERRLWEALAAIYRDRLSSPSSAEQAMAMARRLEDPEP